MNLRKVIQRRIRRKTAGLDLHADVNAVVAANVNEPGTTTSASKRQTVVQRSGRTSAR